VGNQNLALTNGNHPPSVMIATPMYGGMCSGYYTIGIIGAMAALGEAGCKVYFANIMNESLITRARNELARQFLASDYDYLMFVDSDIAFAGDSILRLLSAKRTSFAEYIRARKFSGRVFERLPSEARGTYGSIPAFLQ
jgi:hypothetical protein